MAGKREKEESHHHSSNARGRGSSLLLTRHLAGPRDLPPHLQYDVAIVIVDILLVPDRGSRVHLADEPLKVHRHRAPTSAGGVASPWRAAFAGASIEKRDGAGGSADGGDGRRTRAASSSDARLTDFPADGGVLLLLRGGGGEVVVAASRFIDPRRHRIIRQPPCVVALGDEVSVGLEDDADGRVDRVALGYGYVVVATARRGEGSVAPGGGGDAAGRVVVARRKPLTPPLLPLASGDAAGGGDARGGGRGGRRGARGDCAGSCGARGEAEPSGRA